MYGISSASNLASLFGLGETSFSLPSGLRLPTVSVGTSLYGVNTAKPTSVDNAALNIKTGASALKSTLSDLTKNIRGSGESMFNRLLVSSSDNAVATAKTSENGAVPKKNIDLTVKHLATAQTSATNALRSNDVSFEPGEQSITISRNGKDADVSINIAEGDTNDAVLAKLSDAINASKSGVTATIGRNAQNGTTALSITSDGTGDSNIFNISDTIGMLLATTGVTVETEARNAVYVTDNTERSSQTNDVKIGDVHAELKGTGDTRLSFKRDTDEAGAAIKRFVSAYNDLSGYSERLSSQMTDASATYRQALNEVGFTFSDDGKLSITNDAMEKSLSGGTMKALFDGGATYGYAARLKQLSSAAQQSPQYYAAQTNTYSSYNAERMNTQQNQALFMLGAFYNAIM